MFLQIITAFTINFATSFLTLQKEWLLYFDTTKKARLTQDTLKRDTVSERSPSRTVSIDSPCYNRKYLLK